MKIGFISLGCSKNQIDTEIMLKLLSDAGHEIVAEDIDAEVMLVNTCGFISSAKKEAIDNILDVAWLKENRGLKGIVVTGCLTQRYKDEIFTELPEVDAILGVGSIHDIVDAVASIENKSETKYSSFKEVDTLELGGDRIVTTPDYTAYIKIAEGCDNRCTYCAIPDIRGHFRSRKREDIISEAKGLAELGVKELCVVAQDTTRYGEDIYGALILPSLLDELCEIEGIEWIRLLYCYPDRITDELIDTIRRQDKIIKYIDLPIQHISDGILTRMNRRGGSSAIKDAIKRLREGIPGIVLRTTVIVGFPGESKADFAQLCEFLKETRFERLGCFEYSEEEGTPAASFEGQVSDKVKAHRQEVVMKGQMEILDRYNSSRVGKTLKVLCEDWDGAAESYYGRSAADAPDIDGKVYFTGRKGIKPGQFVNVKITQSLDYDLVGEENLEQD